MYAGSEASLQQPPMSVNDGGWGSAGGYDPSVSSCLTFFLLRCCSRRRLFREIVLDTSLPSPLLTSADTSLPLSIRFYLFRATHLSKPTPREDSLLQGQPLNSTSFNEVPPLPSPTTTSNNPTLLPTPTLKTSTSDLPRPTANLLLRLNNPTTTATNNNNPTTLNLNTTLTKIPLLSRLRRWLVWEEILRWEVLWFQEVLWTRKEWR